MVSAIWLVIAFPLAGAVFLLAFGKRIGEPWSGWIASSTMGAAFVVGVIATAGFISGSQHPETVELFEWIPGLGVNASILWDPLSATMVLIVTGVGALIHIYSIGYMHGDPGYGRYFAYLNLFAASMLVLVLADNYGFLFLGWELVGLCSYLLISFWYEKPSAAAAGKKAFVVNRIGDFGFLIAMMIIFATFGTLSYATVFTEAPVLLTEGTATAITLLLLVGAAGKSAQLPLYVWLPDAMEGPTPVSALIHAATMVTAGVYLVARSGALFQLAPFSAGTVATVGALTAVFAAVIAIGQKDIKRVLAYSTISQLGYMFMGVGVGAYVAGVFHLTTHAFFKALLFMGAGSVIHAMRGEQDMEKMGGLRKAMPWTFITMVVAWLAIIGIPPFAGFWSKDEILAFTFDKGGGYLALWVIGLITAGLTAFYMSRMMFLTFWGKPRWAEGEDPHESPATMVVPLVALAGLTVFGGLINTPLRLTLEHFLEPAFEQFEVILPKEGSLAELTLLALVVLVVVVIGAVWAYFRYLRDPVPAETGLTWDRLENGFYVDDFYGRTIVLPGKKVAEVAAFDVDTKVIDGAVNGVGRGVKGASERLRPLQNGLVRSYAAGVLLGAVGLLVWLLARGAI
jgi:NADH-quinone oxidoreductase subunit L